MSSAVLLVASFPNFNQPWCAWIALVPWLSLLRRVTPRAACWWSGLIGGLFFLGSMWWLTYVTVVGWLILCAYLALYFGIFGWMVTCVWGDTLHVTRDKKSTLVTCHLSLVTTLVIPSLWVALEYLRSHLLSGLGWNLLAYSQAPWRMVIQLADVTGAWGVSFLIVMVNVSIADAIQLTIRGEGHGAGGRRAVWYALSVVCGLLSVVSYGAWRLRSLPAGPSVRVAVVQGNIPQTEKWDAAFAERIVAQYDTLTRAAALTHPDLVVWPETSVPGLLGVDEELTRRVGRVAMELKRPLLVGAPAPAPDGWSLLNSAALIGASGRIEARYDKLHLVPFGEFIPGERIVPLLRAILPPIGEFVPGHDYTVFELARSGFRVQGSGFDHEPRTMNHEPRFSALICFEDLFPDLARQFVLRGARALIVITNDAWFGPTAAAYQHAQASTFRAVELRVPVARAANTGWSGCIDASGRWLGSVRDPGGRELFVAGTHTCDLPGGVGRSLYLRWGDWFALVCLCFTIANLFVVKKLR